MRTLAVLLAAGAGRRFDGPTHKLNATIDGRRVADAAVDAARRAEIGEVIVIAGATVPRLSDPQPTILANPQWARGQATSLRVAIGAAERRGADAIVVGLADQPFIVSDAWRAVAASTAPIAVATYEGRRRNPVRLDASVWPELPHDGDHGARDLIRARHDLVEEVPCEGSPTDIDTWEDLLAWQSKSSTNSP